MRKLTRGKEVSEWGRVNRSFQNGAGGQRFQKGSVDTSFKKEQEAKFQKREGGKKFWKLKSRSEVSDSQRAQKSWKVARGNQSFRKMRTEVLKNGRIKFQKCARGKRFRKEAKYFSGFKKT